MAAQPIPQPANPQGAAPSPSGGGAASSGTPANPLQEILGKIVLALRQLGSQNVIIQPEMQQMSSIAVQALQKVSQASSGPPPAAQAPPQM